MNWIPEIIAFLLFLALCMIGLLVIAIALSCHEEIDGRQTPTGKNPFQESEPDHRRSLEFSYGME
ncbi:MAG: hypothetical protein ACTHMT_05750 [Verrucomicrobiota bacterium]